MNLSVISGCPKRQMIYLMLIGTCILHLSYCYLTFSLKAEN